MMSILWETADQAHRSLSDYGQRFLKALAEIAAISTATACRCRSGR
jgi:hypothetical protein